LRSEEYSEEVRRGGNLRSEEVGRVGQDYRIKTGSQDGIMNNG